MSNPSSNRDFDAQGAPGVHALACLRVADTLKGEHQTGRARRFVMLAFVSLTVCLATTAGQKTFTLPPETAKLKPGPGVELATGQCLLCHSADYLSTQPRLTRTVWQAEVTKMQQKYGAPIATNNVTALVDYLVKNYGKENPAAKGK